MGIRPLAGAFVLGLVTVLALPAAAQADHCYYPRHRHGYHSRSHYYPSYHYSSRRYYVPRPYGYDYEPYYYAPPPRVYYHYHGRARCYRPHLSVYFGW